MGHPIRNFAAHDTWFVTARCLQARNLMLPHVPMVRLVTGGVLARAADLYGVRIYAYAFLANHFHLIIGATGQVIADFMRHLQSNLARKLGPLCKEKWFGRFWERRYSAAAILDEPALERSLRYVLSNSVKEGLVARTVEWEGLHCASQLLDELPLEFPWFDWSSRPTKGEDAAGGSRSRWAPRLLKTVSLRLNPLPHWETLSPAERKARAQRLLDEIEAEHRGAGALGMEAVREADVAPNLDKKRSPRPLCHATGEAAKAQFREANAVFVDQFRAASEEYRAGKRDVEFPTGAFRPPGREDEEP